MQANITDCTIRVITENLFKKRIIDLLIETLN